MFNRGKSAPAYGRVEKRLSYIPLDPIKKKLYGSRLKRSQVIEDMAIPSAVARS